MPEHGPSIQSPWSIATETPSRLAVVSRGGDCTYAELVSLAESFERVLQHSRRSTAGRIMVLGELGPAMFAAYLAALRSGLTILAVSASSDERRLASLRDQFSPQAEFDVAELMKSAASLSHEATTRSDVQGRLAFATSGTTGVPKVVLQTVPRRRYLGVAVLPRYHAGPNSGAHVMANGSFHMGTVSPALYALQSGSTVVVQDEWDPHRFAQLTRRYQAESAFVSPEMLEDLVVADAGCGSSLQLLMHGGAKATDWVKRRAIEKFGNGLLEYYGTSIGAVSEIRGDEWLLHPGSVGRPYPGVSVEVRAIPELDPYGEIVVSRIDNGSRISESPGDIGKMVAGRLYVVSRIAGTPTRVAVEVENILRTLDAVSEVALTMDPTGDGIYCDIESPRPVEKVSVLVHTAIRHLSGTHIEVRVHGPGTLPRNASGKVDLRMLQIEAT